MGRQSVVPVVVVLLACGAWAAGTWADVGSLGDSNGQIAAWGSNSDGQLNVPAGTYTDIAAGRYHSLAIRTDGTLAGWGDNDYGQIAVPAEGTFTAIAGGGSFSLGLSTAGTLAGWGSNFWGQLNIPEGTFTAIAAGANHSLGLRTDGTLAGWGENYYGQSAVPAEGTFTAIAGGGTFSLGLRPDGTLAAWGSNYYGQIAVPAEGTFTAIAAGDLHSLAIRADGTLAGWGWNDRGQTTVPSGTFVAVAAGAFHGLALYARTSYQDLLVNGNGVSDVDSWLNRDITVAGNATIQSMMYTANNPTMTVGGLTMLMSGGGIDGAGTFTGQFMGLPGSSVHLTAGGTIEGSGNLLGTFAGEAGSTITATGPLTLGSIAFSQAFLHNGTLNVGEQNVLLMSPAPTLLSGATTIAGGRLMTSAGLTVADTGSITGHGSILNNLTNHGVVNGIDGVLDLPGVINGDGDFLGTVRFSGLYSPGLSPSSVTLGDPIFSNTLTMELGGLLRGVEYDHIDILGTGTLGGTLNVVLINGFTPDWGDWFDLFDGTLVGEFDAVNLPALAGGLSWDWSRLYTEGQIGVTPLPGAVLLGALGLATADGLLRRRA